MKDNMVKISIVVPVYNNESTVLRAFDSLLSQDMSEIEIVAVDDGSRDSTLEKCRAAAAADSRVKVIHTENRGVAAARNTGIDNAEGQYIMFLDGDDAYRPGALRRMYREIENSGSDIVSAGLTLIDRNGKKRDAVSDICGTFEGESLERIYSAACLGSGAIICFSDKIYSASFLKKHNLRFPALESGEDSVFALDCMLCAEKILILENYPFYYYIENPLSFTKSAMPIEKRVAYSDSFFKAVVELLERHEASRLLGFLEQRKALSVYDFVMGAVGNGDYTRKDKKKALEYIAGRDNYISALTPDTLKSHALQVRAVCRFIKNGRINSALLAADAVNAAKKLASLVR